MTCPVKRPAPRRAEEPKQSSAVMVTIHKTLVFTFRNYQRAFNFVFYPLISIQSSYDPLEDLTDEQWKFVENACTPTKKSISTNSAALSDPIETPSSRGDRSKDKASASPETPSSTLPQRGKGSGPQHQLQTVDSEGEKQQAPNVQPQNDVTGTSDTNATTTTTEPSPSTSIENSPFPAPSP
jgi:hypothetical protein